MSQKLFCACCAMLALSACRDGSQPTSSVSGQIIVTVDFGMNEIWEPSDIEAAVDAAMSENENTIPIVRVPAATYTFSAAADEIDIAPVTSDGGTSHHGLIIECEPGGVLRKTSSDSKGFFDVIDLDHLEIRGCNFEIDESATTTTSGHVAVRIADSRSVTLTGNNFAVVGHGGTEDLDGQKHALLTVLHSSGVVVDGNSFSNCGSQFGFGSGNTGSLTDIRVANNHFVTPYSWAIEVVGSTSDQDIEDVVIFNNTIEDPQEAGAIKLCSVSNSSDPGTCSRINVESNRIVGDWDDSENLVGIMFEAGEVSEDWTIRDNVILSEDTPPTTETYTPIVVERSNDSHSADRVIITGNTVGGLLDGSGFDGYGLDLSLAIAHLDVTNNTFTHCKGVLVEARKEGISQATIANNYIDASSFGLFMSSTSPVGSTPGFTDVTVADNVIISDGDGVYRSLSACDDYLDVQYTYNRVHGGDDDWAANTAASTNRDEKGQCIGNEPSDPCPTTCSGTCGMGPVRCP